MVYKHWSFSFWLLKTAAPPSTVVCVCVCVSVSVCVSDHKYSPSCTTRWLLWSLIHVLSLIEVYLYIHTPVLSNVQMSQYHWWNHSSCPEIPTLHLKVVKQGIRYSLHSCHVLLSRSVQVVCPCVSSYVSDPTLSDIKAGSCDSKL